MYAQCYYSVLLISDLILQHVATMAPRLTFKPLHPTFGAEVEGVDFSSPIVDQLLVEEIKSAVAKVSKETNFLGGGIIL